MISLEEKACAAVRDLRSEYGLNQHQFAQELGVSYASIQRYERVKPPRGTTLARMADMASARGRDDLSEAFNAWMRSDVQKLTGASSDILADVAALLRTHPSFEQWLRAQIDVFKQDQNVSTSTKSSGAVDGQKEGAGASGQVRTHKAQRRHTG
ncbi:MAG: helix-turn-helix transcriptional regulator [Patescibacteria group bacterium]|nr:helix-turn-helix transcriptional regulator [Patescibacteria group bacterium]